MCHNANMATATSRSLIPRYARAAIYAVPLVVHIAHVHHLAEGITA
jgi:hypothetical protein